MLKARQTVPWKEKFEALAGIVLGPEARTMKPDEVIEQAKKKLGIAQGMLDKMISKMATVVPEAGPNLVP